MGHPVYEINYDTIQKQKILKVHSLNFAKVFNWIERQTWSEFSECTSK